MSINKTSEPNITLSLVQDLITEQFPQWADLQICPVENSGWDNRTFRLGNTMLIRLPSAARYAAQVKKEQEWLPKLSLNLSVPIPSPVVMGEPSENYPWNWSVYKWIEGDNADYQRIANLQLFASQLAQFLLELQLINTHEGPLAGAHNFYRGASLEVYNDETKHAIKELKRLIDTDIATDIWNMALKYRWRKKPVWIHGDFSAGNILVKDGKLAAVIDFGCMGVGDPACDLVISWTFLTRESRQVFRSHLRLDQNTWSRARGWALWKALITIVSINDKNGLQARKQLNIINELVHEHIIEKDY